MQCVLYLSNLISLPRSCSRARFEIDQSIDPTVIAHDWFLLGAPWDCSGTGRGEQQAPAALRSAGLSALVTQDFGDADTAITSTDRDPSGVRALPDTVRAANALADRLDLGLRQLPGRRPLVVGGDCSILLGIVPALVRRSAVGLCFLDGHPDFLDGATSQTGETADMDLAILTGFGTASLVGLAGPIPMVPADQVVLLGYRSQNLDDAAAREVERLPVELSRIDAQTMVTNPTDAGRRVAQRLGRAEQGIWLHLDLDVLDPEAFSAVTYPQPGGPNWEQLALCLEPLAQSPRLIGASVADFRADLDPTGEMAADITAFLSRVLP
jgi:arginase